MTKNSTNFFRWVWRFNAIAVAIFMCIAIAVAVYGIRIMTKDTSRDRPAVHLSRPLNDAKLAFSFGNLMHVQDTDFSYMALNVVRQGIKPNSANNSRIITNYLFIDAKTAESRWLFDHSRYCVLNFVVLSSMTTDFTKRSKSGHREKNRNLAKEKSSSSVLCLYVVASNTGQYEYSISPNNLKTIAVSKPDGTGYTELFTDIIEFYGANATEHGDILIAYQDIKGVQTALVPHDNLQIRRKTPVPKLVSKDYE